MKPAVPMALQRNGKCIPALTFVHDPGDVETEVGTGDVQKELKPVLVDGQNEVGPRCDADRILQAAKNIEG